MADDIMGMCDKEHRQYVQYGRQDGKAMKGKILTGVGLLLIAAALLLTVYNIRESDRAGSESEEMVVRMESLTADLPERLETEKKELVPEYVKNPEMEMPTVEVNGQECVGMIEIPALAQASGHQRVERREAQESTVPLQWFCVLKEYDHRRTQLPHPLFRHQAPESR